MKELFPFLFLQPPIETNKQFVDISGLRNKLEEMSASGLVELKGGINAGGA